MGWGTMDRKPFWEFMGVREDMVCDERLMGEENTIF